MIIPKGKKFQFSGTYLEEKKTNEKSSQGSSEGKESSKTKTKTEKVKTAFKVPEKGYGGNAFIGQDVNITVTSTFSRPLEGILGAIPKTVDLVYQGATGTSLSNARFTHLKYWTGTDSPEIALTLVFETQIDSYYDVYKPVIDLMRLVLPAETEAGFYQAPVPTLELIIKEGNKYAKGVGAQATSIASGMGLDISGLISKITNIGGKAEKEVELKQTGFKTDLNIGNNFSFKNIIIKSVSPTFSSQLTYAPLWWIFQKTGNVFSPYSLGESICKMLSQFLCALLSLGKDLMQTGTNSLTSVLPSTITEIISSISSGSNLGSSIQFPSFPTRAEVNLVFETQVPLVRGNLKDKKADNVIDTVFHAKGNKKLY
jgi:hypothetical protein